ncbi:uncharacterized protein LOC129318199 isoform X2 [Prosopis cineraria]|uniref:uncharacterized protein LOC129318199 isoform X2 n=1 Tax=Prosopis cineraria TaxID=364024 RepID=UPI00240FE9C9|nr:uncharacterized protein LOC129318199 isoform X2 [Prosopis cineraria]
MHDLVHEVALWIAKEDIQVIVDSRTTLETSKRYVFWSTNDFPDQFDGTKLEILFLWIKGDVLVKNPETLFVGMASLNILFLLGRPKRHYIPSLSQSLVSLKNMQTLILDGWELGDISILKNLQSLVTLELNNCLIIELPKVIKELKKLRLLGLRECEIQKKNPFEVIETCSQLQELYFVENKNVRDWKLEDDKETKDEITHDISPPILEMFSIACDGFKYFSSDDNGLLKCFNTKHAKDLISKAMFKYILGRVEVLELGKMEEIGWKCLIPDIIHMENGGMNDLIKLCLNEWDEIECLIDTRKHHYSKSFSKLVELHLNGVNVKELCAGPFPSGFLKKLQILRLERCEKLHNIFFDVNFKVPHLKVLTLRDCLMFQPSIFPLSIAQSLVQLEKFTITDCNELKSLITYESLGKELGGVYNQKSRDFLFQNLKHLRIERCHKLELVSQLFLAGDLPLLKEIYIRDCKELKYIFDEYQNEGRVLHQEIMLPSLKTMFLYFTPNFISMFREFKKCMPRPSPVLKEDLKEKHENSKRGAFSWAPRCCFLLATKDIDNIKASNGTMQQHHPISPELPTSIELIQTFHEAECLMSNKRLRLQNIKHMILKGCLKLKSLFSISIATTIMLEELAISYCDELKHIITNEAEDDDYFNCTSIFPNLERLQIWNCNKLEFIFPSTFSGGLQKLKAIVIDKAFELKHVFGKYDHEDYVSNENENDEPHIDLPALEILSLKEVPNIISIHIKKYHLECPSLQTVEAPKMQYVTSEGAKESEKQEIVNVGRLVIPSMAIEYVLNFHNLKEIEIRRCKKLKTMFVLSSWRNLSQLSKLHIEYCDELVNVVEGDSKNYDHINYSSIFSKLEDLEIWSCNKLEFIFPYSFFGGLQKLKYLSIQEAGELKYIFGKYHQGDYTSNESESDEVHIDFPALVDLYLSDVPNMINICAKKCHLSLTSLQKIVLDGCQEINGKSFPDLMICLQGRQSNVKTEKGLMKIIKDIQKLTYLRVSNSKIEEAFNLEEVKIEGPVTLSLQHVWLQNLSELRHIWKAPKYILSLHNLQRLVLKECKKLRSIFCVSIMKSLPSLSYLEIEDCEELVHIVEEDYDESAHDQFHKLFFPKLQKILIRRCKSLKCLFLISTSAMFPMLIMLLIEECPEMEQVFACKQHYTQKIVEHVFPKLTYLILRKLPRLITICGEIDFHSIESYQVVDCPKYQEITSQLQGGPENLDYENQASTEELLYAHYNNAHQMSHMGETSASRNFLEGLEDEYIKKESIAQPQHQDLEETKSSIEACHKTNIPFHDDSIDDKLKERVQEGSTSEDMVQATLLADLAPRNSSSAFTTPLQEEFPLDLTKIESRRETSMTRQQELGEIVTSVVESFLEDTTVVKTKMVTSSIYSQGGGLKPNLLALSVNESIPEDITPMKAKINTSSIYSQESSQLDPPARSTCEASKGTVEEVSASKTSSKSTQLDSEFTKKETMNASVQEGHKAKKASKVNLSTDSQRYSPKPAKDNTVLADVIPPPLHHQAQIGVESPSSPTLGIGEIFQIVELKDGEPSLLANALERYPQLMLPREQRTNRIIALSYRVLLDILVILATKTPHTITALDRSILEANLGEATILGFDKEWIESVRTKISGSDKLDVLVAEKELKDMEAKLETYEIALDEVHKQRAEAKEWLEVIDSRLLGLLEDRKKLVIKIAEIREIVSAMDKPFGF